MSIVKMNRLTLIGLESDKEQILDELMKFGVVDIENVQGKLTEEEWSRLLDRDGSEASVAELEADILKVRSAIEYLAKYDKRKKGLFSSKTEVSRDKFESIVHDQEKVREVVDRIGKYDEELSALRAEENSSRNLIASLEPWRKLDVPLDFTGTRSCMAHMGVVPSIANITAIQESFNEKVSLGYMQVVGSDKDQTYLFVVYHKSQETEALDVLKQAGFTRVSFKELQGTAEENIKSSQKNIENIEKQRNEILEKIAALSGEVENLEIFHDYLQIIRDKKAAQNKLVKTEKTFMLEGWLPADLSEKVAAEISEKWNCIAEVREPEKDEEFPILLDNPKVVKPFEMVTELYSLPKSSEVDPNLLMTPFFVCFFGIMLSDAGYGIILAIVSAVVLLKFKPEGLLKKLLGLVFYGGLSTIVWGALFGGWFGDIVTQVTRIATGQPIVIKPLWFNPMDDPMRLLIWSMIFGGIHLFVGMGIKAYMLIKEGKVFDAIFDIGSWYLVLIGLPLLLAGGTPAAVGKYMAIIGAVMLVLTQGRSKKNIIMKFLSGLLSLYSITGYLSDVLSYSRLLALGLATGVISSVINTVGVLFGFNVAGVIILVIVFLVGHAFNLAINVLGAYVHSSRLQYVEFFSKFYEGGGTSFQPLKINTKYIKLN